MRGRHNFRWFDTRVGGGGVQAGATKSRGVGTGVDSGRVRVSCVHWPRKTIFQLNDLTAPFHFLRPNPVNEGCDGGFPSSNTSNHQSHLPAFD